MELVRPGFTSAASWRDPKALWDDVFLTPIVSDLSVDRDVISETGSASGFVATYRMRFEATFQWRGLSEHAARILMMHLNARREFTYEGDWNVANSVYVPMTVGTLRVGDSKLLTFHWHNGPDGKGSTDDNWFDPPMFFMIMPLAGLSNRWNDTTIYCLKHPQKASDETPPGTYNGTTIVITPPISRETHNSYLDYLKTVDTYDSLGVYLFRWAGIEGEATGNGGEWWVQATGRFWTYPQSTGNPLA